MTKTPQILLIAEGNNDLKFFEAFIKKIKDLPDNNFAFTIPKDKNGNDSGGKHNLLNDKYISSALKLSDYSKITKILLICDADFKETKGNEYDGFTKTQTKLENIIKKLEKEFSNKTFGYFIMPDNKNDGYLENLFLDSANDKITKIISCADQYIKCSKEKIDSHKENKIKAELIVKIIGHKDTNIYTVGDAAKSKNKETYWNFESKALNPLRDFLIDFNKSK